MGIAYILGRELQSLRQSVASPSRSARAAHRAFAVAYGKILAAAGVANRHAMPGAEQRANEGTTGAAHSSTDLEPSAAREHLTNSKLVVHIRPAHPDDEAALIDLFACVSEKDLRFRFGGTAQSIGASVVAPVLPESSKACMTFLAYAAGTLIAVSTLADTPGTREAEVALSVHRDWKGKGVAWTLLEHTLSYATEHGLRTVTSLQSGEEYDAVNLEREMGFVVRLVSASPVELLLSKDVR